MKVLSEGSAQSPSVAISYDAERRLLEKGPAALSDAELLVLVLPPRPERVPAAALLARAGQLLETAGGVRDLGRATLIELLHKDGMAPQDAASVVAAFELGRRAAGAHVENGDVFRTSVEVFNHFRGRLASLQKEVFMVVLLDAKHRKFHEVQVSEGSLTASIVHPREVFAPAVRGSAAAIILVHNHPSGVPDPSPEDLEITRRLRQSGEIIGIRVLDHVIIGAESHFSFVDAGHW